MTQLEELAVLTHREAVAYRHAYEMLLSFLHSLAMASKDGTVTTNWMAVNITVCEVNSYLRAQGIEPSEPAAPDEAAQDLRTA